MSLTSAARLHITTTAAAVGKVHVRRGYADGIWELTAKPNGLVTLGGYAEENYGVSEIPLESLPWSDLGSLLDQCGRLGHPAP